MTRRYFGAIVIVDGPNGPEAVVDENGQGINIFASADHARRAMAYRCETRRFAIYPWDDSQMEEVTNTAE